MQEVWKPIPNAPGYSVSNHGRVCGKRGGILKPTLHQGYRSVWLYGPEVPKRPHRISVLVLETFVGPRPDGHLARHLDDVSTRDVLENLAWGTPRDNSLDSVRNGTHRNARKDSCDSGHQFTPWNTQARTGRSGRRCIACNRAGITVWRASQRGEQLDLQAVGDQYFEDLRQNFLTAQKLAVAA